MSIAQEISRLLEKTYNNFLKVGAYYAGKGDLAKVDEILRQRPEWLNHRGSHGRTMLWEAVNHKQNEMVRYLINRGANLQFPGCHFSQQLVEISPYCLAVQNGYNKISQYLLTKGANYDVFTAAYLGDLLKVKEFVHVDPELLHTLMPGNRDLIRASIMHYAVAGGHEELVRFLGEKGATVKRYSHWLLKFAYWKDAWNIMEDLVKFGAEPGEFIITSVLPKEVQERLSKLGFTIDLDRPDKMGWPPLVYTCRGDNGEHPEEVLTLLEAGADVHARNLHGRTALHTAAKAGFFRVIEVLLANGADINRIDNYGETPLFAAVRSGIRKQDRLSATIRLLMKHGADYHHKNKKGHTVKMILDKSSHKKYLQVLLEELI